jgi:hypothetical protein
MIPNLKIILFLSLIIAKIVMSYPFLEAKDNATKPHIPLIKMNYSVISEDNRDNQNKKRQYLPEILRVADLCAVTIRYKAKEVSSALNMNFKSDSADNWNYEKISFDDSTDKTTESVNGGALKLIQNYPEGKFCVESIIYSCGYRLFNKNSGRSIILNVATIRNAWFKQGNPRFLEVDWTRNCLWFSNQDYKSVRAIDIYPEAFTECENSDENCISKHIEVF